MTEVPVRSKNIPLLLRARYTNTPDLNREYLWQISDNTLDRKLVRKFLFTETLLIL